MRERGVWLFQEAGQEGFLAAFSAQGFEALLRLCRGRDCGQKGIGPLSGGAEKCPGARPAHSEYFQIKRQWAQHDGGDGWCFSGAFSHNLSLSNSFSLGFSLSLIFYSDLTAK